ncbi:hypothetical protein K4K60_003645 [Colletotrichum sp. SAR11_57]|nr:hypothetical protein K4K60_003645 [Colletotrichum sp. SAR11_57]
MRLLHTTTLDLNEFIGDVPPYAILSHTWENDEARRDGFDWAWLDTCCIDKTSSAELSEAINSMFRWYRQARVCYVYLSDLPSQYPGDVDRRQFHSAKWFTRGWTLQELIAPRAIEFYDQNWEEIGTKASLLDLLHDKTGIRLDILDGTTTHTVVPTGEPAEYPGQWRTLSSPYIYYIPQAGIRFDDPLPMYLKISDQQVEEDFRGLDMFTVSLEDNDPLRIGFCRSTIPPGTFPGLKAEDYGLEVFRLPESHAHQVVLQCSVTHRESPHIYSSKVTVAVKEVPGEDRLGCFINTNDDAQASIWEMIGSHSTGLDDANSQNGPQTDDEARRWSSVSQLVGAGPWSDRCAKKLPGSNRFLADDSGSQITAVGIKQSRRK